MRQTWPATRDLVLIGGGHTHALVLRAWGMRPLAGARVTLVNPAPTAPYTGMLPGFVAGHYDRETLDIDLMRLAQFAGARMILGHATGIDRAAGEIAVDDRILGSRRVPYDVASIDIGIHSEMTELPGFAEHGAPAKPLDRFAQSWADHLAGPERGAAMAVIGGGAAGVELAMAMSHGAGGAPVTLIDRGSALRGMGHGAAKALRAALGRHNVAVVEGVAVKAVTATHVVLADGREIPARLVAGATGPRPHGWLADTGLALTDGYVDVDAELRSSDPAIFAAGDCAHLTFAPRPKAGVFAVRQAPILHANLRAALGGGRSKEYRPQRDYLKLISTGGKSAVADKFGLRLSGWPLWWLKDRIDCKFMRRLAELPIMAPDAPPANHARGLRDLTRQAPCGGCAAKIGQTTLTRALGPVGALREDVETGIGDDAAVLAMGVVRQAITVDQISAVTADPRLMAHIAAHHALGDCLAMGAAPQAALPILTLPRALPEIEGRILRDVMEAAQKVMAEAGATIVGGHSATGPEMAVGFAVTGLLDRAAITLAGARPGDRLILTKPLGSGIVLAGAMAGRTRGVDLAATLRLMAEPQIDAALILRDATAMTDVTGFGLAGHLVGMLDASGAGASLDPDAILAMPGALALVEGGQRSTLHDANRQVARRVRGDATARYELLFDPQTAGGLLASVAPSTATHVVETLQNAGYRAAIIGEITAGPAAIRLSR